MTDLPQLQSDLVEAAARRGPRERFRGTVLRAAALLIVVGVAGTWLANAEGPPDDEVPANPKLTSSHRLDRAYAVFRRPARAGDRYPGRVPDIPGHEMKLRRSRLVARLGDVRYYLLEASPSMLCLMSATANRLGGGGCGGIAHYLDGKKPIGTGSDGTFIFAFPDGVTSVEVTTEDGAVKTLPVKVNAVAYQSPSRVTTVRWIAPDGSRQKMEFSEEPPFLAKDFWSVLEGAPAEGKVISQDGDVQAWLAQEGTRLCLRVKGLGPDIGGCRAKVADVRRAIVVIAADSERRLLAAAFPDGVDSAELRFTDGTRRRVDVRGNAIPMTDAEGLDAIRYLSPDRDRVTDRIPASARSAVLNAEEKP